ncbi:valine--tRNA ligase [Jannaschia pagri]|uniref:Valine--tRNA ligase n=1 Tax=Jannaschia pagri TaxID=2829797 RepID=A0ABQ4NMS3_9RHOB|nr:MULTISPECIES: valine--tRNA ligase [unclassified Jannaschia]GIT91883.1 valine--tRNA ligase [Jannaschia sp. AI_61]GIT95717.1 valine--tRNA ligase [Jannaschia sp. AI_62]
MAMDKTFNAAEAEARISAEWIEGGYFKAGANKSRPETFSIVIPPPNVTGSLHMGHAFNNTLQDILTRWHRMRGFDTLWQPGTDHAGIATQMVVERELAKTNRRRTDMSRDEFLDLVWQQKSKSRGNIIGQLQRLGASCDWSREAFTMGGAPGDPEPTQQNFHDAVIKVFVEMYEAGLIYRGKRLVNWDPHFETAISDLEVENIETPGHMWHFNYPLAGGATYEYVEKDEDGNVTLRETRDYISIATTRPETMLGDGAVAVHPSDERYAPIVGMLCEIPVGPKDQRRQIPIITDEYPDPTFGSGAVKITGAHDFNDYEVAKRGGIPLYRLLDTKGALRADGAPYAEASATAMEVAKGARSLTEAETDAINLVPDHLRGLDRFEARKQVVAEITAEGLAVMTTADDPRLGAAPSKKKKSKDSTSDGGAPEQVRGGDTAAEAPAPVPLVEAKPIMQPFGDRSKVVIEPMLTDQWFVDTDQIVGEAISAVEDGTVRILPEADKKVYFHWLRNIEPWCISRQLWWGHRIPVWYGPKVTGRNAGKITNIGIVHEPIDDKDGRVRAAELDHICAATQQEAIAAAEAHYSPYPITLVTDQDDFNRALNIYYFGNEDEPGRIQPVPIFQDPDVLDTWFSSGLWPLGTLGWPEQTEELEKYFPTSVLVTGFDILFFWVARMMMMQTSVLPKDLPLEARIPFKDVYVHALVRDEKGKKMSKSLGNVLDPLDLIDEYGADAVRFTLASMAAMGRDLKLSTQRIAGYRNFGTKLWNAVRFAEMYEVPFDATPPGALPQDVQATVNRWIIGETARVREEVDAALTAYRFDDASGALYKFVWNVVCDWYVELSKPVLQGQDADAKRETQVVMGWVLTQCMTLLHPFMPFITEELWQVTGHKGKLVWGDWPETVTSQIVDPKSEEEIRWVIGFIEAIRSARAQMNVPASARIPVVAVEWSKTAAQAFETNKDMICSLARLDGLSEGTAPKGSIAVAAGGGRFALPLGDVIDVTAERARLEKSLGKLAKEIKGLQGKVNNPKFVSSAPPEVVEESRANLAAREGEAAVLQSALDSLAELEAD